MIKGSDLDKEVLIAGNRTVFDLSGSAASEMVLYYKNKEIVLHKVWVKYIEATSADAGVTVQIGNSTTDNAYIEYTSEVSLDALTVVELDQGNFTLGIIPRDTEVVVSHNGGKSGTGTCYVWFSYTLND
jgi:UDP-N-acetylglucosamine transferase subunit ALG13|tara:strand:- start:322 stop:708 length:387 start_codon:yes stop_codon:yes gene_type:complete